MSFTPLDCAVFLFVYYYYEARQSGGRTPQEGLQEDHEDARGRRGDSPSLGREEVSQNGVSLSFLVQQSVI